MEIKKDNSDEILSIKETSIIFQIPSVTLQRWIYQGKIPYKIIGEEYYFKKSTIFKWAKLHGFVIEEKNDKSSNKNNYNFSLLEAMKEGGIYFDIPGKNVYKVFENSLNKITFFPEENKIEILNQLINREENASTGLGKGIAIPHMRNRFNLKIEKSKISVFFLQNEIDFNAIDKKPVFLLFMMFTTSAKAHLKMLAKVSHLIQNDNFVIDLKKCRDKDLFLKKILNLEKKL